MHLVIDTDVHASDGPYGTLDRIVVQRKTMVVTHLVVRPRHRPGSGTLVPLDWVERADDTAIHLSHPGDDVDDCRPLDRERAYEVTDVSRIVGASSPEVGITVLPPGPGESSWLVSVDEDVPVGEAALGPDTPVRATDGSVGHVVGIEVDDSGHVIDVDVEHGHLWRRRVSEIPVVDVERIGSDGMHLSIDRDGQARQQPPPSDASPDPTPPTG